MFYNEYVAKLCCTLNMLDSQPDSSMLPIYQPYIKTLDTTQLELIDILDRYAKSRDGSGSADLLQRLSNVAYEMKGYLSNDTTRSTARICKYYMQFYG